MYKIRYSLLFPFSHKFDSRFRILTELDSSRNIIHTWVVNHQDDAQLEVRSAILLFRHIKLKPTNRDWNPEAYVTVSLLLDIYYCCKKNERKIRSFHAYKKIYPKRRKRKKLKSNQNRGLGTFSCETKFVFVGSDTGLQTFDRLYSKTKKKTNWLFFHNLSRTQTRQEWTWER